MENVGMVRNSLDGTVMAADVARLPPPRRPGESGWLDSEVMGYIMTRMTSLGLLLRDSGLDCAPSRCAAAAQSGLLRRQA